MAVEGLILRTKRATVGGLCSPAVNGHHALTHNDFCWFKQNLLIHRNNKLNKQVQEPQKQYAYLSVYL